MLPQHLDALARCIAEHGVEGPRLVVLPPLIANVAACDAFMTTEGLQRNAQRDAEMRTIRRAAVRLTYPEARRSHQPWLVMHDKTHQQLRGPLARFAKDVAAVVLAGTAVMDHPRTHWENWPDTGNLFHTAWAFEPNGEPCPYVRHPRPDWGALRGLALDDAERERGKVLKTSLGTIEIDWGLGCADGEGASVRWSPRAGSTGDVQPVERFRRGDQGCPLLLQSSLAGLVGAARPEAPLIASRQSPHHVDITPGPVPTESRRLTWAHRVVERVTG